MNICNIRRTFELKPIRGWKTIYWLVDVHGVIIPGSWHKKNTFKMISEDCVEVLNWITKRKDQRLVLWTSSRPQEIEEIVLWLWSKYGIQVDDVNSNLECKGASYADFSFKPYFNILIDDKSGMEPEIDWLLVGKTLEDVTGDSIIKWNETKQKRLQDGVERIKKSLDDSIVFPKVITSP
jgi:hypothetical protein